MQNIKNSSVFNKHAHEVATSWSTWIGALAINRIFSNQLIASTLVSSQRAAFRKMVYCFENLLFAATLSYSILTTPDPLSDSVIRYYKARIRKSGKIGFRQRYPTVEASDLLKAGVAEVDSVHLTYPAPRGVSLQCFYKIPEYFIVSIETSSTRYINKLRNYVLHKEYFFNKESTMLGL